MDQNIVLQVGVKALLRNRQGKYLLLKRNLEKYKDIKGSWDMPGGRIDPGHSLLDNLKREISEEVGLDLVKEPKLVAAQDILRIAGRHVVRLTFMGEIDGTPRIDDESVKFGWFTPTEIREMDDLDIYVKELIDKGTIFGE